MSDFIERKDIVKWLGSIQSDCGRYQDMWHYGEALEQIIKLLDTDVAPIRRGHWICNCCDIVCSECGTAFSDEVCYMMRGDESYHEPKHCLWCGAEMSEDTEY